MLSNLSLNLVNHYVFHPTSAIHSLASHDSDLLTKRFSASKIIKLNLWMNGAS